MDTFEIITLSIYSVIAFFVGKEFFLPQLNKLYKWLKTEKNETEDRTFQVGEEVHKMKMNDVEYYQETFNTLLGQISSLEDQLNEYSKELSELRSEILQLNAKLYNKAMVIVELQKNCCERDNCPERISCKHNYLCDMIDKDEEDTK